MKEEWGGGKNEEVGKRCRETQGGDWSGGWRLECQTIAHCSMGMKDRAEEATLHQDQPQGILRVMGKERGFRAKPRQPFQLDSICSGRPQDGGGQAQTSMVQPRVMGTQVYQLSCRICTSRDLYSFSMLC